MKLNGRFFPFEEDRKENDPEQDFPIQEKVRDFSGKERQFEIRYHDAQLGFIVDAIEKVKGDGGYYFSAFDTSSPYIALGKLRDKMRRRLSTKHIYKEKGRYYPSHDTLRGRITYRDSQVLFVVDGIPLSLKQLGKMAETYEGWEFTLRFIDRSEDE